MLKSCGQFVLAALSIIAFTDAHAASETEALSRTRSPEPCTGQMAGVFVPSTPILRGSSSTARRSTCSQRLATIETRLKEVERQRSLHGPPAMMSSAPIRVIIEQAPSRPVSDVHHIYVHSDVTIHTVDGQATSQTAPAWQANIVSIFDLPKSWKILGGPSFERMFLRQDPNVAIYRDLSPNTACVPAKWHSKLVLPLNEINESSKRGGELLLRNRITRISVLWSAVKSPEQTVNSPKAMKELRGWSEGQIRLNVNGLSDGRRIRALMTSSVGQWLSVRVPASKIREDGQLSIVLDEMTRSQGVHGCLRLTVEAVFVRVF